MDAPQQHPTPETASCRGGMEEALNLYVDGELSFAAQPALFAHLAACERCRRVLASTMEFRRMSRQEVLSVPAAVDDAFFRRLEQLKRREARVDRFADRRPLWQTRSRVSLRAAATAAMALFFVGLLFPRQAGEPRATPLVEGRQERVELAPAAAPVGEAVYVFYPGLTVEAARIDAAAESL